MQTRSLNFFQRQEVCMVSDMGRRVQGQNKVWSSEPCVPLFYTHTSSSPFFSIARTSSRFDAFRARFFACSPFANLSVWGVFPYLYHFSFLGSCVVGLAGESSTYTVPRLLYEDYLWVRTRSQRELSISHAAILPFLRS